MTTHTYDLLGCWTSTTTPDGGLVQWTYDLAGNKTSEQSPVLREEGNVKTVFGFDFGLLTSITYPGEKPVTMDYGGYLGHATAGNAAGKLVHVDDKARVQDFAYDVNGRLARDVTTMTGPHPNKGPFTTSYDNDWLGRLATVTLPDGETVRTTTTPVDDCKRVAGRRPARAWAADRRRSRHHDDDHRHGDRTATGPPSVSPFMIADGSEPLT